MLEGSGLMVHVWPSSEESATKAPSLWMCFWFLGLRSATKKSLPSERRMTEGRSPLASGSKGSLDFVQVRPSSCDVARGMRPSMLEFLPPKPRRSPLCAKTMVVWRPAVRPLVSDQVLPSSVDFQTTEVG